MEAGDRRHDDHANNQAACDRDSALALSDYGSYRLWASHLVPALRLVELDEQRHPALRQPIDRLDQSNERVRLAAQSRRQRPIIDRISAERIWTQLEPRQLAAAVVVVHRLD